MGASVAQNCAPMRSCRLSGRIRDPLKSLHFEVEAAISVLALFL
jgi:hypothetical protein